MSAILDATDRLLAAYARHCLKPPALPGIPAARGASAAETAAIRATFAQLGFPLPTALLEVYDRTLGIPGLLNDMPILAAPCDFAAPETTGNLRFLIDEAEDAEREGALWLGHGNDGDLMIDRDGRCGLDMEFLNDGRVHVDAMDGFEAAFVAYVERHLAELRNEFEGA